MLLKMKARRGSEEENKASDLKDNFSSSLWWKLYKLNKNKWKKSSQKRRGQENQGKMKKQKQRRNKKKRKEKKDDYQKAMHEIKTREFLQVIVRPCARHYEVPD